MKLLHLFCALILCHVKVVVDLINYFISSKVTDEAKLCFLTHWNHLCLLGNICLFYVFPFDDLIIYQPAPFVNTISVYFKKIFLTFHYVLLIVCIF